MRMPEHITKPTIIDQEGEYLTRGGENVTIDTIHLGGLAQRPATASGSYPNGIREQWDISGLLFPTMLSQNDIVSKIE